MEKILLEISDSLRYYFKSLYLFSNHYTGVYFYLFKDESAKQEVRKYTLLLISFLFFYLMGSMMAESNYVINYNAVEKSISSFTDNELNHVSFKEHFKFIFFTTIVLEIIAYFFTKNKSERILLSRFNFLLVAWFFTMLTIFISIAWIVSTVYHWMGYKNGVPDWVIGIIGLIGLIFAFGYFVAPSIALTEAKKRGYISASLEAKGVFLNILIPILLFLGLKGIFENQESVVDIYFANGPKNEINLQIGYTDSTQKLLLLKTTFIVENKDKVNYIFHPDSSTFYLYWRIVDDEDKTLPEYSDTIQLETINKNQVTILKNTPTKISLQGYLNFNTFKKLSYLKDSTIKKNIHLNMRTINAGHIHLASSVFTINY